MAHLQMIFPMAHLQMIFPARNLHLQWIFHGYVSHNQMVNMVN